MYSIFNTIILYVVAEKEIANWNQLKDVANGSAYAMWRTEHWNQALEIDNAEGLRTTSLMSTTVYAGSQLLYEENLFKRCHQHHKRIDTVLICSLRRN